jgi:hypothetical protein
MSEVVSLAAQRWGNGGDLPSTFSVRDCLEVVLSKIDSGEIDPQHVIICHGRTREDFNDTGFFQAGSFNSYAQLGLLTHVRRLMESGE